MDSEMRRQARLRMERIALFRSELAELEREQGLILTPEQRIRLEAHLEQRLAALRREYGTEPATSTKRISWGMRLVSLLGGAALMAALVLFLNRIWGLLPTFALVTILLFLQVALVWGIWLVDRFQPDRFYTELMAIIAGIGFVMGLNAMGTLFNLAPSPHALLAWSLFALLLAYAFGLRLLLAAGLVLACLYPAAVYLEWTGYHLTSLFDRTAYWIPGAAIIYIFPWLKRGPEALDFALVYRVCGATIGLLALLRLSLEGHLCCSVFSYHTMAGLIQLLGLSLSVGIIVHGLYGNRGSLVNLGTVAFVVFLYARLYSWWGKWMPQYLFFFVLGILAILIFLIFRRLRLRLETGRPL